MQKVDVAIVLVGAAALVATLLGVLTYDDGQHDFSFNTSTTELSAMDARNVVANGEPVVFEWTGLPDNSTAANGTVTIAYSGTALVGGEFKVAVTLTGPNNSTFTTEPVTITISPGPADGSRDIPVSLAWAEVPESFRGTHDEADGYAMEILKPLTISVGIEGDAGPLVGDITFSASASASVTTYHVVEALPDPQAAQ